MYPDHPAQYFISKHHMSTYFYGMLLFIDYSCISLIKATDEMVMLYIVVMMVNQWRQLSLLKVIICSGFKFIRAVISTIRIKKLKVTVIIQIFSRCKELMKN